MTKDLSPGDRVIAGAHVYARVFHALSQKSWEFQEQAEIHTSVDENGNLVHKIDSGRSLTIYWEEPADEDHT